MTAWHTPAGQLDPAKVRAAYPILATKPGGRPLHYLDSAATAQRPKPVIDAVSEFLLTGNANPHRGAYTLGSMATDAYEAARTRTATFLGVPATELVMLGSATEALNLVARSWGRANLSRGDVVLVTEAEHHANLIPWQQVTREADADLEFIPVDDVTGEAISTPSKIKESILQSSEFTTAYDKLPARVRRNVTKEQFAQQVASDLSQKVKVTVDDLPPQLWKTDGGMTQTQKLELFDQSTKKFKQKYPTSYQKTREWLIKKGLGSKKNWVYVYTAISVVYFFGEVSSGAIPDYSDVQDPLEYTAAWADALLKAATAPIGVGVSWDASGKDIESDYFNTLPSFRDYLVDKQNFSKETVASQTRPVFGDVGKYEAMGPDGVKRTYIYDEDQGTYFPYDPSKDLNKSPNTPTPSPTPVPNPNPNPNTYTNDPTGYKKYVNDKGGTYGASGNYVMEDGTPFYKDANGNWQAGSYNGTTFVTN